MTITDPNNNVDEVSLVDSANPGHVVTGIDAVNAVLKTCGVSIRTIESIPDGRSKALDEETTAAFERILKKSRNDVVLHANLESPLLLDAYKMSTREQVAEACAFSGRDPVTVEGGGSLATEESTAPPYPKVYDLASMGPPEERRDVYRKFGRLHVNKTNEGGVGVDEVMMILSSSSVLTWFFQNSQEDGVLKLSIPRVDGTAVESGGFCLSYPGLTPHGAYMGPSNGIVVASITGPAIWEMITEGQQINPWMDFDRKIPVVRDSL